MVSTAFIDTTLPGLVEPGPGADNPSVQLITPYQHVRGLNLAKIDVFSKITGLLRWHFGKDADIFFTNNEAISAVGLLRAIQCLDQYRKLSQ